MERSERKPVAPGRAGPAPRILAGIACAASLAACAPTSSSVVSASHSSEGADLNQGSSAQLVFDSPHVARARRIGSLADAAAPEYARRDALLSARADEGLLTTQWPRLEPPPETQIPSIWSYWGRSY